MEEADQLLIFSSEYKRAVFCMINYRQDMQFRIFYRRVFCVFNSFNQYRCTILLIEQAKAGGLFYVRTTVV